MIECANVGMVVIFTYTVLDKKAQASDERSAGSIPLNYKIPATRSHAGAKHKHKHKHKHDKDTPLVPVSRWWGHVSSEY